MGSVTANDLAQLKFRIGLEHHLTGNHYPPLPTSLVDTCVEVIQKANVLQAGEAGEWDQPIQLPEDITYRGQSMAPLNACIEAWHLDAWIDHAGDCDCDECLHWEDEEE